MAGTAARYARILRMPGFWPLALRLVLVAVVVLAILIAALTAFLILLPFALVAAVALTFYVRRRLRRAARPTGVIEVEYTVVDR